MRTGAQTKRSAPPIRLAIGLVALAVSLNPLNTTMIAVGTTSVQRELGIGSSEAMRLFSAFAMTSALGQPLAGHLADRFGARRVLLVGYILIAVASLGASIAPTFTALVALRIVQALGTSTGFPAGLAILRGLRASTDELPPAWLGVLSTASGTSAALGPALGGALVAASGWRSIFLVSVPLALIGALLTFCALPQDARSSAFEGYSGSDLLALATNRAWLGVCLRFALLNVVFYALFFGLPLWLEQCRELRPVVVGFVMLPVMSTGAVLTPLATRLISKRGPERAIRIAGMGFVVTATLTLAAGARSPLLLLIAITTLLGAPSAIGNLALQAAMARAAHVGQLGVSAGLFQTARFVGASAAAALLGLLFTRGPTTERLHLLAIIASVLAVVLALSNRPAPSIGTATSPHNRSHE